MRICQICQTEFTPRSPSILENEKRYQRYCSPTCRGIAASERQRDFRERHQWHVQRYNRLRRKEIIDFLGGKCSNTACAFSDIRALQIDHVQGDGNKENYSRGFYQRVKENPDSYQCLCANCNWIKRSENKEFAHPGPQDFGYYEPRRKQGAKYQMAMKYTRVLELMKSKGGRVELSDPELATVLDGYKAVSAMSDIRQQGNLEVRTIREGRKAVAYELVALVPAAVTEPAAETTTETTEPTTTE